MLTFLQATVELVELREGQLIFRAAKRFPEAREAQVRVALAPGKLSTLRVYVESVRPAEHGKTVHVSRVLGQAPDLEISGSVQGEALRNAPRHTLGLRVMSRDLPGYHGMTVDLSRTGLQVEITGPVEAGKPVNLCLEFDRFDLPKLDCQARVMWCRSHQVRGDHVGRDNRYRAGLKFTENQGPRVQAQINQVADFFEQRSHEDLGSLLERAKLLKDEAAPAPKAMPVAAGTQRRTSFLVPVEAIIAGYRWELTGNLLLVLRAADGDDHGLEFPDCRTVRDLACGQQGLAAVMRTSSDSELTRWAAQHHGAGPWRHYEFLSKQGLVLLEIVSTPCQEHDDQS